MSIVQRALGAALPLIPKSVTKRVANRYVAGEGLDEALATAERLQQSSVRLTMALLGEEVTERERASAAVDEYLAVLRAIAERGIDSGISIKLTLIGLDIDEGFCRENLHRLLEAAAPANTLVRIDMEDHTYTDRTLDFYREVQPRYKHVGTVLQAYLRRTLDDIESLPADANLRLCKGIYIEPRKVAFQSYERVRAKFLESLEAMLVRGQTVGIATHDEVLVDGAIALIEQHGIDKEQYEFQTLLGVTEGLRDRIRASGHAVRVYLPYGQDWYLYSMRRLRENPKIAVYVTKAMFGR